MKAASKFELGSDVVEAIPEAKNALRTGKLRPYSGEELLNSQAGKRGARFFEFRVGCAPKDPLATDGSRRLVLLVQSGRIAEMYFSDNHYRPGSWWRIIDF